MSDVKATETPIVPIEAPKVDETVAAAPVETGPAPVEAVAPATTTAATTTTTADEVTPVLAETAAPEAPAVEEVKEEPAVPESISEGYLEFKPHGLLQ